ncbi:MAG: phosphoglycolate phosphatase [Xanthobacteraceae bacterium]
MLIVFDLDGTLIDTAPDLVDTLNVILAREGLAPVPFAEARSMIGAGARRLLERGLARDGGAPRADELERLYKDFLAYYANHMADRSRPFPGLEGALDELARQGHRFAVCTNKLESLSAHLLKTLNLGHRFDAICGQDTFGTLKPDPDILRRTIARAGGDVAHALVVGDSMTDVATARAAGIPVIAVEFGYADRPATALGADAVVASFAALPDAVEDLVRARQGSRGADASLPG